MIRTGTEPAIQGFKSYLAIILDDLKSPYIARSYRDNGLFSIIDIIAILTESQNPRRYSSDLKIQLSENEGFIQLHEKTVQLKLQASHILDDLSKLWKKEVLANSSEVQKIIQSSS